MSVDCVCGSIGFIDFIKKYEEDLERDEKLEKALKQLMVGFNSAARSGNCSSLLEAIDVLSACEDDVKKMIAELEGFENWLLPLITDPMDKELAKKAIEQLIDEAKQLEKTCSALLAVAKSAEGKGKGIEELATGFVNVFEQKKKIEEAIEKLEQNLQKLIMQIRKPSNGQNNPFTQEVKLMLSENIDSAAKAHKKQTDTTAAHLELLKEAYAKLNLLQKQKSSQDLGIQERGKTNFGHAFQHFASTLAG